MCDWLNKCIHRSIVNVLCNGLYLQQTKAKYEIEAEKRELARLLEKRTQEVENLTGLEK